MRDHQWLTEASDVQIIAEIITVQMSAKIAFAQNDLHKGNNLLQRALHYADYLPDAERYPIEDRVHTMGRDARYTKLEQSQLFIDETEILKDEVRV